MFNGHSFVSRLLGMGDVRGLVREISENVDMSSQSQMVERFSKGLFTLRDMYEQFQNVLKMGNIGR